MSLYEQIEERRIKLKYQRIDVEPAMEIFSFGVIPQDSSSCHKKRVFDAMWIILHLVVLNCDHLFFSPHIFIKRATLIKGRFWPPTCIR